MLEARQRASFHPQAIPLQVEDTQLGKGHAVVQQWLESHCPPTIEITEQTWFVNRIELDTTEDKDGGTQPSHWFICQYNG